MRTTKFFFAAAALSVGAMSMGCELIASVDRSQINPGDTSSSSSSSSSTSSTSTSSGMAGAGGTAGMGGMAGAGGTAGMGGAAGMGGMGGAAGMGGMGGAAGMGGMGGAAGMGGGGGAGGGGMPCQTPSDCPTAPNECVVATCNGGMCGTMFVAAGTSTSSQMAGDCKRAQCNGAGAIVTVNDDADVPVDQKDCTDDVCMAGSPSNPPLMMGTKCGAGMTLVCDGMGNCIGCNQPTDCSGMDTECQTRTCVTGMCGVANTPQGTVLQMQTPNDCKTAICDDMGNTGTTFNGADLPGDDGNACTMAACDMVLGPVQNPVTTNDNDACTTDACDPMTGISHTPVNTNDNNACTTDACDPMTGVSHTPVVVDDNNACTTDACDPMTGVSHTPVVIDDNNACTADACDPMTGVSHTPVVVDDGNACTVDACNTMTGAITHDPVNIDDNNVCTVDACNTMTGVSHTPVVIDDGNACTTDACDPMTGISHTAINIDDMVACTADACDPMTGESHITNDSLCGPLNVCDLTGCMPAIAADQVGSVVITEFSALGTEFIELYNPSASPVDIRGYVVRSGTSQPLSIRSATDPTDAMSTPVTIAANGYVWGVVNPSNAVNIPAGAAFVIGAPGATMALGDTGDAISVYGTQGLTLQDTVDFTQFHANETAAMPATAFPGFAGLSTQVEPTLLTATGNDSGANWCTSFYPATGVKAKVADTKGAGNGSCKVAVVNEAFIDPSATDDGKAFIEIAGPGGGLAAGMKLDDIEGTTAPIGVTNGTEMVIPAGTRIPVDGILLVADELGTTGTTQVPGFTPADVIVNDVDYENNGGDAIQLISANNVLLDVVGHSPSSTNFTSNTAANGYAMYEAQVAAYPPSNSSLARNATNTDTDHNGNDFHGDPSPTPGIANDLVNFTITSLTPDDGLANIATTGITVFGTDLAGGMTLAVGGNAASTCAYVSSTQMTCTAPTNNGTVARVGITATNQASVGAGTFSLPNSFTYTGVLNELGVAGEADFCNVQFPTTFTVTAGQATPLIFGRIFEDTVTQPAGAPTGVLAELGYGPAAWTPLSQNSTTGFMTAPFNTQVGNDDEFQISFVAPIVAGMYRYVYRFSLDGGLNYTYCDTDGAGSNTGLDFNEANAGLMTVQ